MRPSWNQPPVHPTIYFLFKELRASGGISTPDDLANPDYKSGGIEQTNRHWRIFFAQAVGVEPNISGFSDRHTNPCVMLAISEAG